MTEQLFILLRHGERVREMFAWNYQNVHRRLWIDVIDGNAIFVFEHRLHTRNALDEVAEKTLGHEEPPPEKSQAEKYHKRERKATVKPELRASAG